MLDLTPGFNGLSKDNYKMRRKLFQFCDSVRLILKLLRYLVMYSLAPYLADVAIYSHICLSYIDMNKICLRIDVRYFPQLQTYIEPKNNSELEKNTDNAQTYVEIRYWIAKFFEVPLYCWKMHRSVSIPLLYIILLLLLTVIRVAS